MRRAVFALILIGIGSGCVSDPADGPVFLDPPRLYTPRSDMPPLGTTLPSEPRSLPPTTWRDLKATREMVDRRPAKPDRPEPLAVSSPVSPAQFIEGDEELHWQPKGTPPELPRPAPAPAPTPKPAPVPSNPDESLTWGKAKER